MILVIYDNDKTVVDVIESIRSPVVESNNVEWEGGSVSGINLPFLLLDDDVEIGEVVTDETFALDKKSEFTKVDELAKIKEENRINALAIMELAELFLGGI